MFAETAYGLSDASRQAGKKVEPAIRSEDMDGEDAGEGSSKDDLRGADATNGFARTGQAVVDGAEEDATDEQGRALFDRLKEAVASLREHPGYFHSIAALRKLVRHYAKLYYTSYAEEASSSGAQQEEDEEEEEEEWETDEEVKQTMQSYWAWLRGFGDTRQWDILEARFRELVKHADNNKKFEHLLSDVGNGLLELLTDSEFFDSVPERVNELTEKFKEDGATEVSDLRRDMSAFLTQLKRTLRAASQDRAVAHLTDASKKLYYDVSGCFGSGRSYLAADLVHAIIPRLVRAIRYVPIPRLEILSKEVDLLVENLVFEPAHLLNLSSFLPPRTVITTRNDIDIVRTHSKRVETDITSTATVTVAGLNFSASNFGFWANVHAGPFFRFQDEGVASFHLDRRGIDITLDIEIARDRLEQVFRLRGVRVCIHKLSYKVHRSKHRFFLWLLKPFLKQLLRRVLERQIAERLVAAAFSLNRELVFARERLRATRVASPPDLSTFVRAVLARGTGLSAADESKESVFDGIYAPGSLAKLWDEGVDPSEVDVRRGDQAHGRGPTWRNSVFDITPSPSVL